MKKIVSMLMLVLTVAIGNNVTVIKAEQNAYEIGDDYVIIDYEKYDLIDNKITFEGKECELINNNLIGLDDEGVVTVIPLPVKENMLSNKEKEKILQEQAESIANNLMRIESRATSLPYSKTIPSGQRNAQTPKFDINIPGKTFYRYTYLTITKMPLLSSKNFSVAFIYSDIAGNWYDQTFYTNYNFGSKSYIKYLNLTTTRYGIISMTSLNSSSGYTYTISVKSV